MTEGSNILNREKLEKKHEKTQTRKVEARKREIIEDYLEEAQFEEETREGIEEFLNQEDSRVLFEYATKWIKENKEKIEEKTGIKYDPKKRGEGYVIGIVEEMGGFEAKEMEEFDEEYETKYSQEINCFHTLRQELDKDDMSPGSQLLALNLLNEKSSRIGRKMEKEKDEAKKAQMQEEFDKLFNLRKQVATKITGENLITQKEEGGIRKEAQVEIDRILTFTKKGIKERLGIGERKRKEQAMKRIEEETRQRIETRMDEKINEICGSWIGTKERIKTLYQGIRNRRIDEFIEKKIKSRKECIAKELEGMIERFEKGKVIDIPEMLSAAFNRENELKTAFKEENPDVLRDFLGEYGIEIDKTELGETIKGLKEKGREIDKISIWDCLRFLFDALLGKKR